MEIRLGFKTHKKVNVIIDLPLSKSIELEKYEDELINGLLDNLQKDTKIKLYDYDFIVMDGSEFFSGKGKKFYLKYVPSEYTSLDEVIEEKEWLRKLDEPNFQLSKKMNSYECPACGNVAVTKSSELDFYNVPKYDTKTRTAWVVDILCENKECNAKYTVILI